MHEIKLKNKEHYEGLIEITKANEDMIPVFLKNPDGDLTIIPSFSKEFNDITEGYQLVYLGKKMELENKQGEGDRKKPNEKEESQTS
jgi:hypothetical protein